MKAGFRCRCSLMSNFDHGTSGRMGSTPWSCSAVRCSLHHCSCCRSLLPCWVLHPHEECCCLCIFNRLFLLKPSKMLQNLYWRRWDFWTDTETSGHITVFQVDYLCIVWKNISWDLPWTVQKYFPMKSKGYKVRCSFGLKVLLFLFPVFSVHQNVFTIIRPFCRHKYRTSLAVTPRLKGLSQETVWLVLKNGW